MISTRPLVSRALKPGARLLLAKPRGDVKPAEFEEQLRQAASAGLVLVNRPQIRHSHGALLEKAAVA
jgi:hypothetical protein